MFFFILVILKEDGHSVVSTFSWRRIITVPLFGTFFCLICFLCLHFYSLGLNLLDADLIFQPIPIKGKDKKDFGGSKRAEEVAALGGHFYDDMGKWLRSLDTVQLELYHEVYVFRAILLIAIYGFYVTYSAFLIQIPCHHCDTPYRMMGIALVITYGVRILCCLWNFYFDFYHYGLMATEVAVLKQSYGDYRFFRKAAFDLYRTSGITVSGILTASMFAITLAFALLNTLWIGQHLCESSCPRVFSAYKYLQVALFILEVSYVVSVFIMMYLRRSFGVEGVEKIVELVVGKAQDEQDESSPSHYKDSDATYGDFQGGEPELSDEPGDDDESILALRMGQNSVEDDPKDKKLVE